MYYRCVSFPPFLASKHQDAEHSRFSSFLPPAMLGCRCTWCPSAFSRTMASTGDVAKNDAPAAETAVKNDEVIMNSPTSPDAGSGVTTKDGKKSNYYFFKSTPAHLAEQYKPKPIEATNAAAVAGAAPAATNGASAWNKGGTWEEKVRE